MKHTFRTVILTIFLCCPLLPGSVADAHDVRETADSGTAEPAIILDITFDDLPEAPVFIGMARMKFPAGAAIVGGSIVGPRMFLIETGRFTVLIDDAATIWRKSDPNHAVVVGAGGEASLESSDLLIVGGNPPFRVVNSGDKPATLLDIVIWPPITERVRPFVTEAGVIFEPLAIGDALQLPESPARIVLERFSLQRNGEATFEMEQGPQLLYVESGILGVATLSGVVSYSSAASNAAGSVAGRVKMVAEGDEALLTAGGAVLMQAGSSGAIRNLGRTELDLLNMRFEAGRA